MANFGEKLIFIKKNTETHSAGDYIPCLFYRNKESHNFLIYFHGNSENVFQIEYIGLDFRSYLEMNVILVEYPGYFLKTNNNNSDPNIIFSDSLLVYDWIKSTFQVSDNQIFVCGRSLGTSPSIYLSSHRNPKALFLISAFTSIKKVGEDKFLSIFLEKIFKSIDYIANVKCPILLIHGEKDKLISYKHSEQLWQKAKERNNNVKCFLIPNMDHNNFNLKEDIIDNIIEFCSSKKLLTHKNITNDKYINENKDIHIIPLEIKKLIEVYVFDINELEIEKKFKKNNASILMNFNNDKIILLNGSIISLYNFRYFLDYEIILKEITKREAIINSLYQNKNGNLICATEGGGIFIFKINKKNYEIVNSLQFGEEIYKIGDFYENKIFLLSKNVIEIRDEYFQNTILRLKNNKTFINYCLFSERGLALIKHGHIQFNQFEKNYKQMKVINEIKLKSNISINSLVGTNKYLILGGINQIFFFDVEKKFQIESKELKSFDDITKITYITKIHEQFLLASTNNGSILQININDNGSKEIITKYIENIAISSILMIDYETILICGNDEVDILSIPLGKEKKDKNNCLSF